MMNFLRILDSKYEIGDPSLDMQMYISRHDGNVSNLDLTMDWIDYILTPDWIRRLVYAISLDDGAASSIPDHRISYLSDMV